MPIETVVTGLGTIGPYGFGREALAKALAAGKPVASEVDRGGGWHREGGSRLAALIREPDLSRWIPPAAARRMSFPSKLAVAAGKMALPDAGIETVASEGGRAGVYLATAFGPVHNTEKLLRQIFLEGAEAAQPFYFSECVANTPAAQLAIAVGARGPNVTIVQREAGPLLAVGRGAQAVREGRVDRALAGAVEEIPPLLHALLGRFGALAQAEEKLAEQPRPLDRRRNGILAGEGASLLVLEREDAARARGARILARVRWSGAAFDATAGVTDWGTGHDALAAALRAGLATAGGAAGISMIVSGASGAKRGDLLEARVLKAVWGEAPLPPVMTPKAVTGEYGGGILAAGLLALEGKALAPFPEAPELDPEIGFSPHRGAVPEKRARVLLTGLASGGAAAWLLLERAS
ncbi:MAG TPA: beta-ketoacyl synthase N-terminal-like domain-containing protein [Candidatus Polarisedimenticolia bacterium]|jgi:3-oxoacyl-[acyl-carrier-protein] synthase II|nr:beta-ketoacyl synthase N-terminal-like domain-containing protein [Candidatus Polarisedimenticolia bacterium]